MRRKNIKRGLYFFIIVVILFVIGLSLYAHLNNISNEVINDEYLVCPKED